jgi:hypothetical protein
MAKSNVCTSSHAVESLLGLLIDPFDLPQEAFNGLRERGLVMTLRSDGLGVILTEAEHDAVAQCSAWLSGLTEVAP